MSVLEPADIPHSQPSSSSVMDKAYGNPNNDQDDDKPGASSSSSSRPTTTRSPPLDNKDKKEVQRGMISSLQGTLSSSRRNLMRRTGSMQRLYDNQTSSDTSKGRGGGRRCLLKRNGSENGFGKSTLSSSGGRPTRCLSDRRLQVHQESSQTPSIARSSSDRRLLLAKTNFGDSASRGTSPRKLFSRAFSDRRVYMTRTESEKLGATGSNFRLNTQFFKGSKEEEDANVDATELIMLEMKSSHSAQSILSNGESSFTDVGGLNDSASVLVKSGSRRDLLKMVPSSSSVRNLFGTTSSPDSKERCVSFAQDENGKMNQEIFSYAGPTDEEKALVYDSRSEEEIFSSTTRAARTKLVAGSGLYKMAIDSAFGEKWAKQHSFVKSSDDTARTTLFRDAVNEIAASDLRGLEEIYSRAIQFHREQAIRKIIDVYVNKGKLGNRRLAKLAAEESSSSVKFARMLALADARQVEHYLARIDKS